MCSSRRAWIVAASVGVVEALKDQGICRWNNTMRSAQQYAKNNLGSLSQTHKLSSSLFVSDNNKKSSEESFRTVLYLSSWGPN